MKELIKIIKKIDGTVLGIGLKEELIRAFERKFPKKSSFEI